MIFSATSAPKQRVTHQDLTFGVLGYKMARAFSDIHHVEVRVVIGRGVRAFGSKMSVAAQTRIKRRCGYNLGGEAHVVQPSVHAANKQEEPA